MNNICRSEKIRKCFDAANELKIVNEKYRRFVLNFFDNLLSIDLENGDVSQQPEEAYQYETDAAIIVKSFGIVAGLEEAIFILENKGLNLSSNLYSGNEIHPGDTLLSIKGKTSTILTLERTILNILQRLSGIATITKKYTDLITHTNCFVAATRKTFWGLLDKRAVQCGGGLTHRLSLYDAAMLKENHLAILKKSIGNQAIKTAIQESIKKFPSLRFIEVEVTSNEEFWEIVNIFNSIEAQVPKVIMFDHFLPEKITSLIEKLKTRNLHDQILLEASGNISLETVVSYAESGVDVISVGALTHSAPSMDYSLIFK